MVSLDERAHGLNACVFVYVETDELHQTHSHHAMRSFGKPSNLIQSHYSYSYNLTLNHFPANWVWPGEFLQSVPLNAYNYNIKNHLTISTG